VARAVKLMQMRHSMMAIEATAMPSWTAAP
jgi:hypothetical protein